MVAKHLFVLFAVNSNKNGLLHNCNSVVNCLVLL